jgi:hypothetical protein
VMDAANQINFKLSPRYAEMWRAAIDRDKQARGSIDLTNYIRLESR